MARGFAPLQVFNRGRISRLGLARTDLDRVRLSADVMINWVPRTLGSMMLRPGLQYIGAVNSSGRIIPFIRSATDTALIEASSGSLRFWVSDSVIQRNGSTSAVSGGTFTSTSLSGWTDADESGSTSEWVSGNYMGLTGTRYARAIRRQTITANATDHGLNIVVERGYPVLKVGSSAGGDDYISETTLKPGTYSFLVTSTGNFVVELSANTEYATLVDTVSIESSGDMTLPTPWLGSDLGKLRWKQSADVVFCALEGYQQRRIERYAAQSWASVLYAPDDGPFRTINITSKRLNPSALSGNITLACDQPVFNSSHVGALYRVTSLGQKVTGTFTAGDQWSDSIRVSGVTESRVFDVTISSVSTEITVRVQRSVGEEGSWTDVTGLSWTSSTTATYDDGFDNQIIYYRIGSGATDFVSTSTAASASAELSYASGGKTGIAKLVSVPSATESSAIVLSNFGSTSPSELWSEGEWSGYRGYPSAITLHEGRTVWAGKNKIWASVSDAYDSFDDGEIGDSGPIGRSIGEGPTDRIEWMLSQTRLVIGTQGQELQAKTSSLEEPLTPTNFSLRDISTQGSANVQAIKIDQRIMFVQAGGTRVMEISSDEVRLDLQTLDRTVLVPEIGEPSIIRLAVQRQPDTRVHCVRSDGAVGMMVSDPAENVLCWLDIESSGKVNGAIEEVAVLPGTVEDSVYYVVRREINGSTKRYLEKWALESEARGGSTNKIADSFIVQNSTSTTTVSGLDHLVGSSVVAWGSTTDLGTYTVSTTGTITLSQASTFACVGLPYSGLYKSAKLAYASRSGTALTQRKQVNHVGIIAADMQAQGLQFGPSTSVLDPLPRVERGVTVSTDSVWSEYDSDPVIFPKKWDTDSRLVLFAQAPRPVTVLGAILDMETKDKT